MNLNIYKKTRYQNIYKHTKNGTYAIDISLGYNELGKRIRTTRTGINSIDEAKDILNDKKKKYEIKSKIQNNLKFKFYWGKYIYDCENIIKLEYNTLKKKKYAYNHHISTYFDNRNINEITKYNIQEFHNELDKKELSDRTKNDIHKILSAFFNWLVKEDIIIKNPVSQIVNYKYKPKEKNIWTQEQFNNYILAIEKDSNNNPFKAIFTATISKLFFLGGFRLEELLAIKKSTISENGIYIQSALIYQKGIGYVEKSTKTNSSERMVDFNEKMINTIKDYINFFETTYNIKFEDNDYIFVNPQTMKPFSDTTLRKYINYYSEICGNPKITPHSFRHSHATLLHDRGWDMFDIKRRLGHSNMETTEKIYCHLSNNRRKQIAKDMDEIL